MIRFSHRRSSDTKLTKDEEYESVDSTKYRGMIDSLVYLTASRLDIMFSVCLCARFQEGPKTSHLEAVKCIFQYIKGTTHLGLWYPKGTRIETIIYADYDHAGDYVDQKSTSGNIEMEPDIENMMMNEYLEYEAAKERKLWDDVRSRKSPTNYDKADVDSFHRKKNIVQDSIWDQDDDLEENQEDDGNDRDTFDIWDITAEDVERIRQFFTPNVPDVIENDEILNDTMVDEGEKCNPAKDLEELKILLAKEPQSNFTEI
ncbi:hypothetical protein Tco_0728492 [Tanacetum coccineum]|uniref:Retrovirus-related Pol polyprotein from transposon TNT 1-94 n=1 Tax=Tanacetum coccineum TaxID=301880 RepID=A0ABQ4YME2_9ASTR